MKGDLLSIKQLTVGLKDNPEVTILKDVSIAVSGQSIVGIVGGSGSGKTTLGLSILGLLPSAMSVVSGEIILEERKLHSLSVSSMRHIRGKEISMVFQEPMSAFNPVMTISEQIGEALLSHQIVRKSRIKARVLELLDLAGIAEPKRIASSYPHELSGGLRQRAMIAQALSCNPKLLIADEPTSNLDVTLQAKIMELLSKLQKDLGLSIVLITHDLGVVKYLADEVVVLNRGLVVEKGPTQKVMVNAQDTYTRELLSAGDL